MQFDAPGMITPRTERELASGTGYLSGSLRDDGRQLLVTRSVVQGDAVRRQFSLRGLEDPAETPLGPPLDGLSGWDWNRSGSRLYYLQERGPEAVVSVMPVPGGRGRELIRTPVASLYGFEAAPDSGLLLFVNGGRAMRRMAIPGLADSTLLLPAAAGFISEASFSPDGREVATVGWDQHFDSVLVHRVSLADGSVRRLAVFSGEGWDGIRWLPDHSIVLGLNETEGTLAWFRLPAAGGAPRRLGTPPRYPASYRLSADGRSAIARRRDARPDVHLIRNFGELLGRR
jgi:hypothetical protein